MPTFLQNIVIRTIDPESKGDQRLAPRGTDGGGENRGRADDFAFVPQCLGQLAARLPDGVLVKGG